MISMISLRRITTEFIEAEDRLRLAGEVANGRALVLWLTPRLLNRLLPHLFQWVEQRIGNTPLAGVNRDFTQQKARVELTLQTPIRAEADAQSVLVPLLKLPKRFLDLRYSRWQPEKQIGPWHNFLEINAK